MTYISGENYHKTTIFSPTIDDDINDFASVRVLYAFIYGLDFATLGFLACCTSFDRPSKNLCRRSVCA